MACQRPGSFHFTIAEMRHSTALYILRCNHLAAVVRQHAHRRRAGVRKNHVLETAQEETDAVFAFSARRGHLGQAMAQGAPREWWQHALHIAQLLRYMLQDAKRVREALDTETLVENHRQH